MKNKTTRIIIFFLIIGILIFLFVWPTYLYIRFENNVTKDEAVELLSKHKNIDITDIQNRLKILETLKLKSHSTYGPQPFDMAHVLWFPVSNRIVGYWLKIKLENEPKVIYVEINDGTRLDLQ